MRLLDYEIWRNFFKFDLSGKEFNALPEAEMIKYFNMLKFMLKETASEFSAFNALESGKLRKLFRQIDRRIERFLFG